MLSLVEVDAVDAETDVVEKALEKVEEAEVGGMCVSSLPVLFP